MSATFLAHWNSSNITEVFLATFGSHLGGYVVISYCAVEFHINWSDYNTEMMYYPQLLENVTSLCICLIRVAWRQQQENWEVWGPGKWVKLVHSSHLPTAPEEPVKDLTAPPSPIILTSNQVQRQLSKLPSGKSVGQDGVSPCVFRACVPQLSLKSLQRAWVCRESQCCVSIL